MIRAFEAAERNLSVTKAALELNVTQGAISHQIKALEQHLGVLLVKKNGRALALTVQGEAISRI
jgi:LysR family transcriptional regulator, glycine cleavage system transcriptional activator